jgi:hypothetical protein
LFVGGTRLVGGMRSEMGSILGCELAFWAKLDEEENGRQELGLAAGEFSLPAAGDLPLTR